MLFLFVCLFGGWVCGLSNSLSHKASLGFSWRASASKELFVSLNNSNILLLIVEHIFDRYYVGQMVEEVFGKNIESFICLLAFAVQKVSKETCIIDW